MRIAHKAQYQTISDLFNALRDLKNQQSYRYQERLKLIVNSMFGVEAQRGLLTPRIEVHLSNSPISWAAEAQQFFTLLGPESEFTDRIIENANTYVIIEAKYLPKNVLAQFPQIGAYQSRIINGLRRDVGGSFYIYLWEWYWSNILYAYLNMPQYEEKRTLQEQITQDQFYFNISRNFYLGLIRKTLKLLHQRHSPLLLRLISLVDLFLVQELLAKFGKGTNNQSPIIDIRYKLRSHYFYLVYVMIVVRDQVQNEIPLVYYDFLNLIALNYSSVTIGSTNYNIRNLMRVWLTLAGRSCLLEHLILNQLQNANKKEGWFRLERCPIQQFSKYLDNVDIQSKQLSRCLTSHQNILKLLKKNNEWNPKYCMLPILEQMALFDVKVLSRYRQSQGEKIDILAKSFERVFKSLLQQTGSQILVKSTYQDYNQRFYTNYKRNLQFQLDPMVIQRSMEQRKQSKTSFEKRKFISYHNPRQRNVWEYPVQHNEFIILYQFMYWLADQLDKLIPGHKPNSYPRPNFRIMCNPLVFIFTMLIIGMIFRLV